MALVRLEAETRAAEASIVVEIRHLDKRIAKSEEEVNRMTKAIRATRGVTAEAADDGKQEKSYSQLLQAQAAEAHRYFQGLVKNANRSASAAE